MNQNNRPEQLRQILKNVIDPEVEVNIVDLGLVYNIECPDELTTNIEMTLATPAFPSGEVIVMNVIEAIKNVYPDMEVDVNLVFDPPWSADMISEEGKAQLM